MLVERRRHRRRPIHFRVVIKETGRPLHRSSSVDVGARGMLVEASGTRLRCGRVVAVILRSQRSHGGTGRRRKHSSCTHAGPRGLVVRREHRR